MGKWSPHFCKYLANYNQLQQHYCQIWTWNKYASQVPHMPIRSCAWETTMSIYLPDMNSVESAVWPGTLVYRHFTLLGYASEQTFLPHSIHMCHLTVTVIKMQTLNYDIYRQKTAAFIYHAITIYVPVTNISIKSHIYAT